MAVSPKIIPDPGFPGDGGGADPALAAALEAWPNRAADDDLRPTRAVVAAVHGARLLVPVVAIPTELAESGTAGLRRERTRLAADPLLRARLVGGVAIAVTDVGIPVTPW